MLSISRSGLELTDLARCEAHTTRTHYRLTHFPHSARHETCPSGDICMRSTNEMKKAAIGVVGRLRPDQVTETPGKLQARHAGARRCT
eukprot:6226692-Prymnesium_polylepis.1